MKQPLIVMLALLAIISLGVAWMVRYDIEPTNSPLVVYVMDRWLGEVYFIHGHTGPSKVFPSYYNPNNVPEEPVEQKPWEKKWSVEPDESQSAPNTSKK